MSRNDRGSLNVPPGRTNRGAPPPPATAGTGSVNPAGAAAFSAASAAAPPLDPAIEALQLRSVARKAAYALKQAHPSVTFTSGRRTKEDQARAMASNVVSNRKWIGETYKPGLVSTACQQWVDDHPEAGTQDQIASGLLAVMHASSDAEVGKLSKHLSGDAFDVRPVEVNAKAIKATIESLEGLDKFLDKEGGLVRWHAQF